MNLRMAYKDLIHISIFYMYISIYNIIYIIFYRDVGI